MLVNYSKPLTISSQSQKYYIKTKILNKISQKRLNQVQNCSQNLQIKNKIQKNYEHTFTLIFIRQQYQIGINTSKIKTMSRSNVYDTQQQRNVIQVATELVDSVTHLLFSQISTGNLKVDEQQSPLQLSPRNNVRQSSLQPSTFKINKSKLIMQKMKTIDIDQHKRMVRRFMSQNKRIKRQRQLKSYQLSQKAQKIKQQQQKQRQLSRNKALQQRRKSIQRRMEEKKSLLRQIQKSTLIANSTVSEIQKKKFLYQQKQEQYYKKFVLPKISQENQILQKKRQAFRKPIDMNQILQHQRSYESYKINSRVNRSLTISVIKTKQKQYHPPQFVPESYKKIQQQEQNRRMQEQFKKRQAQINQIRKKQFVKKVQQLRQRQHQLSKSRQKLKPQQPQEQKLKAKPKLNRQQVKNVGNQYLRELLNRNRKLASKKLKPLSQTIDTPDIESMQSKKAKSSYQVQIIKQERVREIHKIRNKKIHQLMHNKNIDEVTRHEKLKYQIQKLDLEAEQKLLHSQDIQSINQSALIMMNSIQAKMALLGVDLDNP